ncbi:primosomal protein DnaI [Radiobacillus sp. PE A8.2]|uniref:primosomal protein DnaI n=1 Tax=Radiobacillus sp. PE A8.2 TaxID=3380349 RepID=UPI00388E1478
MEPIQASLKKWMRNNKSFQDNFLQMKQAVLNDPEIASIIRKHPEMTEEDIDKNLIKLYEYQSQSKQCSNCASLAQCKNILQGYSPYIHIEGNKVQVAYEQCHQKLQYDEQRKKHDLIQSLHMPKDILEASMTQLDFQDPERHQAIREIDRYIQSIDTAEAAKGIYFHGPFGVGKTYFLGAIAKELADKHISSMMIYMPEFVREIKASFKDDSVNQKIELFKKVDVLMLDDIGAESLSAWFRDEVLGSILQYRMMQHLPVFFTSNFNLKQLEQHLATTTNGDTEKVKAGRIIERIQQVSKEVPLFGANRRS